MSPPVPRDLCPHHRPLNKLQDSQVLCGCSQGLIVGTPMGVKSAILRVTTEPFSPELAVQSRGSARWCGKDRAGWGWCARGPPGIVCSDQLKSLPGGPRVLSYPATGDVPESIAHTICLWLAAHRRAHDARPWQRAATCRVQAVLLLRWMVAGTALTTPARDSKASRATAYRYLHEALGVIADRAPDLPEVLDRLRRSKEPFVCLDGTLIRTDRVAQRNPDTGRHLWYSGLGRGLRGRRAGGDGFSRGSPCTRVRWSPAPPTT